MKVLVCGGRNYTNKQKVFDTLDRIHNINKINCIIHGKARGADKLGEEWAKEKGISIKSFPADWKTLGKIAGAIRNEKMANENPDICVAFKGGSGTKDMKEKCEKKGIKIISIND